MPQVLNAARTATLRVFYAMHHRYRPGDYETWKYIAPIQKAAWARKTFEYGTWGGEFRAEFTANPGEVVVQEHWCSSGFANTDLDLQLKKHGIHQLIVIGLIAHTCVEATVRRHGGKRRDGGLLGCRSPKRLRSRNPSGAGQETEVARLRRAKRGSRTTDGYDGSESQESPFGEVLKPFSTASDPLPT
jgi:hypothetical protein